LGTRPKGGSPKDNFGFLILEFLLSNNLAPEFWILTPGFLLYAQFSMPHAPCGSKAKRDELMTNGDGWIANLGRARYLEVLDLQRKLVDLRQKNSVPDTVLLVEHEPIITLGRRGRTNNILSNPEELASQGIQLQRVERGGDVTYHGPGQLVVYPIVHLTQRNLSVRGFVDLLEEAIIQVLADFGIQAGRDPQHRGVWVEDLKVAALGVAIRRWVSFHGIALNVSPNMDHFCHINPCELRSEQVTSMAKLLGDTPNMEEVVQKVVGRFVEHFPGKWREILPTQVFTGIQIEYANVQAGVSPGP
jgi:lipoate-protein ligase B